MRHKETGQIWVQTRVQARACATTFRHRSRPWLVGDRLQPADQQLERQKIGLRSR